MDDTSSDSKPMFLEINQGHFIDYSCIGFFEKYFSYSEKPIGFLSEFYKLKESGDSPSVRK